MGIPGAAWRALVTAPLRYVLMHGPRVHVALGVATLDVGFWQGTAQHEVCAAMTGTPATVWLVAAPAECERIIQRRVHGMEILIVLVIGCYVAVCALRLAMYALAYGVARRLGACEERSALRGLPRPLVFRAGPVAAIGPGVAPSDNCYAGPVGHGEGPRIR